MEFIPQHLVDFLSEQPGVMSRSQARMLISCREVSVNDVPAVLSQDVKPGDVVKIGKRHEFKVK